MKTVEFLNRCTFMRDNEETALIRLKERYGIKHRKCERTGLYVLNYDQIESSKDKFHEIVCECRSLVLGVEYVGDSNEPQFYVVSRAFSRFFNYGEKKVPHKITSLVANEKLDGSLITVFHHEGKWIYRTKSMIMPEEKINGLPVTWKEVIEEALGDLYEDNLEVTGCSLIFEVTSPENRVVTRYKERKATLLAIRKNDLGTYLPRGTVDELACKYGWERPKTWTFQSWEGCLEMAKDLRDLEEGFVMYNTKGKPVAKVKNPDYVLAHHLRGEGILNPKRIVDLILTNELDEYLSIFPEDGDTFKPYLWAYGMILSESKLTYTMKGDIVDQKGFALEVKDHPCASILFRMRKGLTALQAFDTLTRNAKQQLIESYL